MNRLFSIFLPLLLLYPVSNQALASVHGRLGEGVRPVAEQSQSVFQDTWSKARMAVKEGRYEEAESLYYELVSWRPRAESPRWELAELLVLLKKDAQAEVQLNIILEENSKNIAYLFLLGDIKYREKNYVEASRIYRHIYNATTDTADNIEALERLVRTTIALGDIDSGLPLLEKLVNYRPEDDDLRLQLAGFLLDRDLQKAQVHYSVLLQKQVLPMAEARRAGLVFNQASFDLGTALLEYYLKEYPKDNSKDDVVSRLLANWYLERQYYSAGVEHLLNLLEGADASDVSLYNEIADVYGNHLDRPDRALSFYEKSKGLAYKPAVEQKIEQLQRVLAENFLVLFENSNKEQLWEDVSRLSDAPEDIFLAMAEKFYAKNKVRQAKAVLDFLSAKYPNTYYPELIDLYCTIGDFISARKLLDKVPNKGRDVDYYIQSRKVYRALKDDYHSYQDGIELVLLGASNRLSSEQFFAEFTLFSDLTYIDILLQNFPDWYSLPANKIELARVYRNNGLYSKVEDILAPILADKQLNPEHVFKVQQLLAQTRILEGRTEEAEQIYRQLLFVPQKQFYAIQGLMEIALANGNFSRASQWLYVFEQLSRGKEVSPETRSLQSALLEGLVREAEGNYEDAFEFYTDALDRYYSKNGGDDYLKEQVQEARCINRFVDGDQDPASCKGLPRVRSDELKSLFAHLEKDAQTKMDTEELFYRLEAPKIDVQGQKQKEREWEERALVIAELKSRGIESSMLDYLGTRNAYEAGDYDVARQGYEGLLEQYSEEDHYVKSLAHIDGRLGRYQRQLALVEQAVTPQDTIKTPHFKIYTSELLAARALWRLGFEEEALEKYKALEAYLAMGLDALSHVSPKFFKKSYWQNISSFFEYNQSPADRIMSAEFFLLSPSEQEYELVNAIYPQYSWHRLVKKEYQARRALHKKQFVQAERYYRELLSENGTEQLMVDLAPIYRRLGQFEREAKIYQDAQSLGINVDYLSDEIDENERERTSSLSSIVAYSDRAGRSGAIDMKKYQLGVSTDFYPIIGHNYSVDYVMTDYSGTGDTRTGHLLQGLGTFSITDDLHFGVGLGLEKINTDQDYSFLGKFRIDYRLLDQLRSFAQWSQARVDDTIMAVEEQLLAEDLLLGFIYESPKGLDFGLEYIYRSLSDNNDQDLLNSWVEYTFFGDRTELGMRYDFEYISGSDGSLGKNYWNPANFKGQSFSLSFRYNFDRKSEWEMTQKRYFELGTSLGLEDDDNMRYSSNFDIYLEINPRFLLKGSLLYSQSDDYDESRGLVELIYRWQ